MNKIIILISMLILSLSIVSAAPAGDTVLIHRFDECINLIVDVEGSLNIDDGEYQLEGCDNTFNNTWYCDCNNNYDLLLTTNIKTLNNYTFYMLNNYAEVPIIETYTGGSKKTILKQDETSELNVRGTSKYYFYLNDTKHSIQFINKTNDDYIFVIRSTPVYVSLKEGEYKLVSIDGNVINISIDKISYTYKRLNVTLINNALVNDTSYDEVVDVIIAPVETEDDDVIVVEQPVEPPVEEQVREQSQEQVEEQVEQPVEFEDVIETNNSISEIDNDDKSFVGEHKREIIIVSILFVCMLIIILVFIRMKKRDNIINNPIDFMESLEV
jgi:hypothetical protein